jgi:hypothetical protein
MILPRYFIERVYLPTSTPGSWYDTDHKTVLCKTLELAWRDNKISNDPAIASCIMEGIYLVRWQAVNPSRPYPYFRFVHVPGRHFHPDTGMSSVLVHRGNKVEDLLGCICPGSRHTDVDNNGVPDLVDSGKKLQWLTDNIEKIFELEIRKKPDHAGLITGF